MKQRIEFLTGRLILIQKELSTLLIKYNPEIKDILIGHGMGVHSMGINILLRTMIKFINLKYSFTILIYEIGVIGFIFVILFIFYFISFFRRELTNLSEENKKKIFKSILIIPIILLFTGFQFYRDFALQFFYFLMVA